LKLIGVQKLIISVATRQDSPTSDGVAFWNGSSYRFDTDSDFTYTSSGGLTINDINLDDETITFSNLGYIKGGNSIILSPNNATTLFLNSTASIFYSDLNLYNNDIINVGTITATTVDATGVKVGSSDLDLQGNDLKTTNWKQVYNSTTDSIDWEYTG